LFDILTLEGGTNTLSQNIGNQSTYAVQQPRIGKDRNCIAVQATNLAIWRVLPWFYLAALVQQVFLTPVVGSILPYFNIILNVKISIIFIFVTILRPLKFPDAGGDSVWGFSSISAVFFCYDRHHPTQSDCF